MSRKLNCWDFKKCGREPGGLRVNEMGVCPAATESLLDEVHEGCNGGRACWAVVGTYCNGKVQGTFATKMGDCVDCEFYTLVQRQEGRAFEFLPALFKRLRRGA